MTFARLMMSYFLLLSFVTPSIAGEVIQGPHNTDPKVLQPMPESWVAEPLTYKDVPPGTDIAITLDQQLYPALTPLIAQYAKDRNLNIAVKEGTCGISSGALDEKAVDMAGFCCPPAETDRLPGLQFHTLGIGAIALLANLDNPITNLSIEQARQIFQGQDVSDVPGQPSIDAPLMPVARLHCKMRPGHWRLILDNEDLFSPLITEVSTIKNMIAYVVRNTDAIGYETLWWARYHGDKKVKLLHVNGVSPEDDEALAAGQYPFYRTFNITSWRDPKLARPEVDALVAYLKKNFHTVDKKFGFIAAERLQKNAWVFVGDEVISPPK